MNCRLIAVLINVATIFDDYKALVFIFNYDKLQWMKEQVLGNQGVFENLFLLQVNGNVYILSYQETQVSWIMATNYTFFEESPWLGREILKKSKQLSVIALDRTFVKRHIKNPKNEFV